MNYPFTSYKNAHTRRPRERKAFALVLSLALMGFMVLLVVTLATMVQQQLRLSRQSLYDFKARQAAKFAAYQAMSRVQETLGPDQRISANAMIFEKQLAAGIEQLEQDEKYEWWKKPMEIDREEVENISSDDPISENRNWVGVWYSHIRLQPDKIGQEEKRDDYIRRTVDEAVTWLVSGNKVRDEKDTTGSHLQYKPTQKLNPGQYVRAVAEGSTASSDDPTSKNGHVLAPIVTLKNDPNPITNEVREDGKQTRIAWWVADEGQKASLNAIAPKNYITLFKEVDYRMQSLPFYSGINGLSVPVSGGAGIKAFEINTDEESADPNSIATLRNLTDVKQIDILKSANVPSTTQLAKLFFHGVTFNTKGLLVNVREGGFKKDLSLGLTRLDYGNEEEDPGDKLNENAPEYFPRPYGTAGYEYKTSAYPLLWDDMIGKNISQTRIQPQSEKSRINNGLGHMFPPQMFVHDDLSGGDYEGASTIGSMLDELFSDKFLFKDPGGPLWSQLRSYYNLRAENDPAAGKLKDRIQTDDRHGFKPVVKRFQIFYVPTFVHYGSQRYGVRLHIIPMLILYNPYDTKIAGDSYYILQVNAAEQHPIGSFRFAVGYRSGENFQCLRDLRTELIPSLATQVIGNDNEMRRTYIKLSNLGIWNQGVQGWTAPDDITAWMWDSGSVNNSLTYRANPMANDDINTPLPYFMSTKTFFYDQRILPLGYGTTNNRGDTFTVAPGEIIAPNAVSQQTRTWENDNTNVSYHWKGIIGAGNIVPSIDQTLTTMTNTERWSARVARIPLYLNNLYMSAYHGRFVNPNSGGNTDRNNYLFRAQRGIAAYNSNNVSTNSDSGLEGDLRFVAYSEDGIEPGKAVIFVMKEIVAYVGDPEKSAGTSSLVKQNEIGPNGVVEYQGRDDTPYEDRALMLPYEEVGTFGGCFYMDVPHPESEHYLKYSSGATWDYSSLRYANVLFDLNPGSKFSVCNPAYTDSMRDVNNNTPPSSISQYYIDMQDVTGWHKSGARPLNAMPNMTPIGYAMYAYMPNYEAAGQRLPELSQGLKRYFYRQPSPREYHKQLTLNVWLWKRDGFKFEEIPTSTNNSGHGVYTDFTPMMAQVLGYRIFLGNARQSFPDPTLVYSATQGQRSADTSRINFHMPGHIRNNSRLTSLRAFEKFYDTDQPGIAELNDITAEKNFITAIQTSGDDTSSEAFRARYYINWLALNPRRHSANYWRWYGQKINNGQDFLGDASPESVKGDLNGRVVECTDFNYHKTLHDQITAGGDETTLIPYGIIFAQPYAENMPGSQPFFNRRLFVNGDIRATFFGQEYCGRDVPNEQTATATTDGKFVYNTLGRISSNMQVTSQIYSSDESVGDGMSNVGYSINMPTKGYAYVGMRDSIGAETAPIHHILRRTEVVSNPANLASANLSFGVGWYKATDWNQQDNTSTNNWYNSYHIGYPDSLMAPFAIGNSLCPSRILPDRSYHVAWLDGSNPREDDGLQNWTQSRYWNGKRESDFEEDRHAIYDMSWHLNNVLWDEYFFSTLPYRIDDRQDASRLDPGNAYPLNPRLQYVSSNEDDYIKLSDLDSIETEDQFDENASKLWINGPFNVNSTNIDAWKAILSIHYGEEVQGYSGSPNSEPDRVPFLRWEAPFVAEAFQVGDQIDSPTVMQGYRSLSEDEIEELACAIVEHIKDRGPFYSMSHFVNRVVSNIAAEQRYTDSLGGQSTTADPLPMPEEEADRNNLEKEYDDRGGTHKVTHMQKGVLQAAIDSTNINSSFHDELCISIDDDNNMTEAIKKSEGYSAFANPKDVWENWRGAIGPQATGAPAYLMQQDILSKIGSFLTVRSDTFKIRAYGEIKNSITGSVESKAWCEMVIQRMPEYIDVDTLVSNEGQKDTDTTGRELEMGHQEEKTITSKRDYLNEMTNELSELNKALGRRFKVVSFRWLNDSEI